MGDPFPEDATAKVTAQGLFWWLHQRCALLFPGCFKGRLNKGLSDPSGLTPCRAAGPSPQHLPPGDGTGCHRGETARREGLQVPVCPGPVCSSSRRLCVLALAQGRGRFPGWLSASAERGRGVAGDLARGSCSASLLPPAAPCPLQPPLALAGEGHRLCPPSPAAPDGRGPGVLDAMASLARHGVG